MNQHLQSILNSIQQSEHLSAEEKNTLIKAVKDTDKEIAITEFKLDRTEKVKRTTAILLEETIAELEQKRRAVEEQNKELEIEAALEKVRIRSLAMQKSSELSDLSLELVQQVQALGIETWFCAFNIYGENDSLEWGSNGQGTYEKYKTPRENVFLHYYEAGQRGETLLINEIGKNECAAHYEYLCTLPGLGIQLLNMKAAGIPFPVSQIDHVAFHKYGYLLFITYKPVPEAHDVFKRFAKVFEQTYTRFLDLQKAEAQARESQIQLALERVRARTMAMQKSEDLLDVINTFSEQLTSLNINFDNVSFGVNDQGDDFEFWLSSAGQPKPVQIKVPYADNPAPNRVIEAKKKGLKFFTDYLTAEENRNWVQHLMDHSVIKELPEKVKNYLLSSPGFARSTYILKNINLYIGNYKNIPYTEEENNIFKRFAQVFEQSYIRFLDLQKAEAQARESQIQLALERVRAKTMAMQKSDELPETSQILFQQLTQLGDFPDRIGICLVDEKEKMVDFWLTDQKGVRINTKFKAELTERTVIAKLYKAWKEKQKSFVIELHGKELNEWIEFVVKQMRLPVQSNFIKDSRIHYAAFFSRGWIIVTTHQLQPPETIDIIERFAYVFNLTYQRFLDLQKAETQAREAQIEASLERVRSRSMAMHKSDELKEVIRVVLEQFAHLKINAQHAGFYIDYKAQDDMHIWLADPNLEPFFAIIPYFDTPTWNSFLDAKANGIPLHTDLLNFEEKNKFYQSLFELFTIPEEAKQFYMQCKGLAVSTVLLDNVGLYIENFSAIPYTDEENKILIRFGKVFQQTYTRFLDLQKAEAQAREAQIEAALERVRSRSLAMHRSDELKEVIDVVFSNLNDLNISRGSVAIWLFDKQTMNGDFWVATPLHKPEKIELPYDKELMKENTTYKDSWEAFSEGKCYFNKGYSKQQKDRYFNYVFSNNDLSIIPQATRDLILKSDMHSANLVVEKHSTLFFDSWNGVIYDADSIAIFKRISRVFEQAYVRFLDLQKSEAQAREAQIEAALERVRSRAMAMQTSEELNNLIGTVFTELTKLDVSLTRCAILIYEDNGNGLRQWMINSEAPSSPMSFFVSYSDLPYLNALLKAWNERSLRWEYLLEGEDKFNTDEFLLKKTELSGLPDFVKAGMKTPEKVYISASFNNFGCVALASLNPLSDTQFDILIRFAKVFDLTYTRFNDLKVAEAQAREAQIETALERVRSRTMSMQKSSELLPTAEIMFDQLKQLGAELQGVAFAICDENSTMVQKWTSIGNFSHPYDIEPGEQRMYEAWKNQSGMYEEVYEGEKQKKYYELFMEIPEFRQGLQKVIDMGFPIPTWQKNYAVPFKNGYVLFIITKPFNETQIFLRFGKVFEQTYTRFLDLQKAEAATKEVIKQAALDRIRADIASMRTTKDLERITPLIWNELSILGIPFVRCGVFIMDEDEQLIHTFLSTPEGKAIAAIHIPYNTPGKIRLIPENWKKKTAYTDHWKDSDFSDFANTLAQNRVFESSEQYLAGIPHGGFYLHFLPFLQGMMYVGNATELSDDEINLIQAVADAFSSAYSRYEDFNKLEAAKKQVDSTLTELQATQKQLIQSEKMASLGELTAGIAHEIQNPLNFVNNFSEVSTELVNEMKEELAKSNYEDANVIADDLKQNLEKINHHGKRAGDIVKGMLQHSRTSTGIKESTDINALCDEYLRLSYHGMRAKDKSFNATMKTEFDGTIGKINIIPQDIGRVLLNIINNAFYAVRERARKNLEGLGAAAGYDPTVTLVTRKLNDKSDSYRVEISIKDNGNGIPPSIVDKIFQPFFTTKPTGQGTGLGLSLSYDIVKAHGGEIKVETKENESTVFVIQLPISQ